jgi:hypothetical protein
VASPDPVAGSGPYQAQGLPAKPTARNRAFADCADVMSSAKKNRQLCRAAIPIHD